ncbi:MAG: hypothetical protein U1E73_01785 [Planctomycetota bacterium]
MKSLAAILAAAVISGLCWFLVFDRLGAFGLMNATVTVNVTVFVLFIAALTVGAGALAVIILRMIDRSENRRLGALELRIRQLEKGPAAPTPPASS